LYENRGTLLKNNTFQPKQSMQSRKRLDRTRNSSPPEPKNAEVHGQRLIICPLI